jgi:cytochrome oxidase Cu insertion factor (SCO1/SenC/PrrC family)
MGDLNKTQRKTKKITVLFLVVGVVAAVFSFPSGAVSKDVLSDANFLQYKEKNRAPDFNLKDPDDTPTRLEAFGGKIVLLYFWTTW